MAFKLQFCWPLSLQRINFLAKLKTMSQSTPVYGERRWIFDPIQENLSPEEIRRIRGQQLLEKMMQGPTHSGRDYDFSDTDWQFAPAKFTPPTEEEMRTIRGLYPPRVQSAYDRLFETENPHSLSGSSFRGNDQHRPEARKVTSTKSDIGNKGEYSAGLHATNQDKELIIPLGMDQSIMNTDTMPSYNDYMRNKAAHDAEAMEIFDRFLKKYPDPGMQPRT
ncbi:hypothetical protein JR316_0012219 [Psilocybe cubensis]|uniref:Uncharacterized protein n=2 Tax=Psilocybe cubensis TaxID=181762 RepID=A0ACB8GHS0_PSICU|nr:hypothetical protein JR316_0012219 [Psilocybe cubensis]KAH9475108.1 hypothetical protein JR316_0012219 [Psilocybe cubensis]